MAQYRIKYETTGLFGEQYALYQRRPFWYFFSRWVRTHLCDTESDAKRTISDLKTRPKEGTIVYEE